MIITIGGAPGSGKSTVGRMLATRLNIPFFSMGDIRRKYALERGMTIEQLNELAKTDPSSDRLVDEDQIQLAKLHTSLIIDSRLGYYFIPHSIKIYVKVDRRAAAERIFSQRRESEHWATVDDGVESLRKREEGDKERYIRLYDTDPTNPLHYDIVLDSTVKNPVELMEEILAFLRKKGHEILQ